MSYTFGAIMTSHIRNFCIIAHIDHGKSTLADRLLHLTGTVSDRDTTEQILDTMDLEREKGVTIKASAVRMDYTARDGQSYELNLIDTPGHVDFGYEVSRALNACEGAVLVVDASQGIEAQTLANLYAALEANLEIIPVINKIDLQSARPDEVSEDIASLLGVPKESIIRISAKEGTNVPEVLEAIVRQVPPPKGDDSLPLRALIFDSHYDSYKGVIAYIRVMEGAISSTQGLRLMATRSDIKPVEIGIFAPNLKPMESLTAGEVGYVATGLKTVHDCRVGDTVTASAAPRRTRGLVTVTPSRWYLLEFIRPRRMITPNCAMRWISFSSTTHRWSSIRRLLRRSVSVSAPAFSACSTWKLSRNGLSVSTTWTWSLPPRRWPTRFCCGTRRQC